MLVNASATSLVALATTVDVDGLKLGLGGNSHGGLDLDAENFMLIFGFSKWFNSVIIRNKVLSTGKQNFLIIILLTLRT